jgi:hypothetical protein
MAVKHTYLAEVPGRFDVEWAISAAVVATATNEATCIDLSPAEDESVKAVVALGDEEDEGDLNPPGALCIGFRGKNQKLMFSMSIEDAAKLARVVLAFTTAKDAQEVREYQADFERRRQMFLQAAGDEDSND